MKSQKVSDSKQNEDYPVQNNEDLAEPKTSESQDSNIPPFNDVESSPVSKSSKSGKCRKNDHCIQQALRSLHRLSTPEEKFTAICAKYADIFDENRKLKATLNEHQKQITSFTKDKDQTRSELMKTLMTKDKLENLCRELQRQNKEIREESLQKIRDEEQKRKEVSSKFQTTLNEITDLMKQDSDKTMKLRDDNIDMTSKLKSICEQYEIREQQIEKMSKQMALESQLYEAKIAKMEMETAAEKELLLREKQQLLLTLTEYQARFQEYQNIEVTLRNQVALYNNKYEEFEKSLTRSNEVFGGFKNEMENMSNKIVKLESETAAWKMRWEKTQKALIEMASEKQKSDQEIVLAAKQMATLHKLCRTLQSERSQLLARLKNHGSSQSETTEFKLGNSDDNKLLESKIIDENLEISQNSGDIKNLVSKSKTKPKSSQVAEKSQSVPKTKFKADKKHVVPIQNHSNKEALVKINGIETSTGQMNIDVGLKKDSENQDCESSVGLPSENSNKISPDDILNNDKKIVDTTENLDRRKGRTIVSSENSLPGENIDIELKSESRDSYIKPELKTDIESPSNISTDDAVTIDERSKTDLSDTEILLSTVEPSAFEVKADVSISKADLTDVESVPTNCSQSNRRKALQKKKNKK